MPALAAQPDGQRPPVERLRKPAWVKQFLAEAQDELKRPGREQLSDEERCQWAIDFMEEFGEREAEAEAAKSPNPGAESLRFGRGRARLPGWPAQPLARRAIKMGA